MKAALISQRRLIVMSPAMRQVAVQRATQKCLSPS